VTAPVIEEAAPSVDMPQGAHAINLPVMAIEGLDTADGRYLEVGAISHRALPITLFAQVRTPDGGDGHDNAYIVGAVTEMTRRPGPEVIQKTTGQPFPEGTFVWSGKAWMYDDVPSAPDKSAFELVRDRALSGNSIDLSDVVAAYEYAPEDEGDPDARPVRVRMQRGVIAATTLVGQPAFPDAYVELDGELLVPDGGQALTASAISWRSQELGDDCAACMAGVSLAAEQTVPDGEAPPVRRDGMIALVPAEPDALTVDGGDPADQLHLTLAYLGDDVASWPESYISEVHAVVAELVGGQHAEDGEPVPAFGPARPLVGNVFSHAVFNPNSDNGRNPATVYLFDGDADRFEMEDLARQVQNRLRDKLGEIDFPEQHNPWVPHLTAGYGVPVDGLTYTGPVTFDRVRVALGGEVTDYPLGGDGLALVASALPVLPSAAFSIPEPDHYVAPHITEPDANGWRYYVGHIAQWGACHIGFADRCVNPPRSRSNYTYFHTGMVRTDQGDLLTGVVTFNRRDQVRGGHARNDLSAVDTVAFYDNTSWVGADVRVVDGKYGPWACGVVRRDLSADDLHALRASGPSGDWRRIQGSLDLVSVLHVNTQGYLSVQGLVASGQQISLVASAPAAEVAQASDWSAAELSEQAEWRAWRLEQQMAEARARLAAASPAPNEADVRELQWAAEVDLLQALEAATISSLADNHLPPYIKRIANHLKKKGMDQSRAIATAWNAAKKMCATGDTNWPGHQEVNAGSRAEACAAVATIGK
jgi:hypothetical protein